MADQQAPPQYPRPDGQHDTDVLGWPTSAGMQGVPGPGDPYYPPSYAPAGAYADAVSAPQHHAAGQAGLGVESFPGYAGQPGFGSESFPGYAGQPGFGAESFPGYAGQPGNAGQPGYAAGWAPGGPGGAPANPEAAYWESRFRRQRLWTRLLGATIAAGVLLFVGGSLFVWNVVLPRATNSLSQQLGDALPGLGLPDSNGAVPGPGSPDDRLGDGDAAAPQDLSDVPLPGPLQGLGSKLGIDNVEELLDTAVSMGLMSQEQADQIRETVAAGGSLQGLLGGSGSGQS